MNRLLKALSLTVSAAAVLGTGALQAAGNRSEPLEIPFAFTVQGKQLPAGTYRLHRAAATRIEELINVRTGEHVQMLRPLGHDDDKVKLIFERQGERYVLRRLS